MTRPGIEPRSPGPLVNTLTIMPMSGLLAEWVESLTIVWETWFQSQVMSYQRLYKWYLILPCLILSNIKYASRVKWSNSGKGVAPSPTPWCCSYLKGNLSVTLDYGRQLYFITHKRKLFFFLYWYPYPTFQKILNNWIYRHLHCNSRKFT